MTLREEQERVQKAVNSSLSHVQADPWLAQRVLAHAKGERPVKRKISLALILCILLGLALMGTGYALFSSQAAEFFGKYWNRELGNRLLEGKAAQIGESVTVGDAVVTLDEIVYKDRRLYGVGTVRPANDGDILVPYDAAEVPEYFAQNQEAQRCVALAKASGGKLLTVVTTPTKIGVDDGTMLSPGTVGFYDVRNEDGSLTFSFEAADGFVLSEGTSYQIQLESWVKQINENGESLEGKAVQGSWTVSCAPVQMNPPTTQATVSDVSIADVTRERYALNVPDVYRENGVLPVYQAEKTDFTATVQPEWFNSSGIADASSGVDFRFADHALLSLAPEALFYNEYLDDSNSEAYSDAIVRVAWVRNWEGHTGEFTLDQTSLTGITLADAQRQAEALIARLGIDCNQYVCDEALDMSLARIQAMGALYEQAITDGELTVNADRTPYDYSAIPDTEEGFLLHYSPWNSEASNTDGRYGVTLLIGSRGVVYANIRNQFNRGDLAYTPEQLIGPEEAIGRLLEEYSRSRYVKDDAIASVQRVSLIYALTRADNKAEGMVFTPAWLIDYQDGSAARHGFSCYGVVNAVDGSVIDASFN